MKNSVSLIKPGVEHRKDGTIMFMRITLIFSLMVALSPIAQSQNWNSGNSGKHFQPGESIPPGAVIDWQEDRGNFGVIRNEGLSVDKPYALSISNAVVRSGAESLRFEIREGDCGISADKKYNDCSRSPVPGEYGRVEVQIETNSGDHYSDFGEAWYAWSMFIPKTTEHIHPGYVIPFQMTEHTKFGKVRRKLYDDCSRSKGQYLFLNWRDEGFVARRKICTESNSTEGLAIPIDEETQVLVPYSLTRGLWQDFLMHAKWDENNGFIHLWWNGFKIFEHKGKTTGFDVGPISGEKLGARFKFGIYRGRLERLREQGITRNLTQIAYFDEFKRGNVCEEVSQFMECKELPSIAGPVAEQEFVSSRLTDGEFLNCLLEFGAKKYEKPLDRVRRSFMRGIEHRGSKHGKRLQSVIEESDCLFTGHQ